MKTILAFVCGALICGVLAAAVIPRKPVGPSAGRVAGDVVRGMAASAGVRILGDKIYSIKKLKDGRIQVAVRVKYLGHDFLGSPMIGVTTVFVRLLPQSDWTVVG